MSDRFLDGPFHSGNTLLREEGGPLHVNEIYNRLLEGGFKFTGANPTISVAVSLNRNSRFRKVSPGTFDLMIRDASKAREEQAEATAKSVCQTSFDVRLHHRPFLKSYLILIDVRIE